VKILIDIQAGISLQGHFTMDIRGTLLSAKRYPCFMDISLKFGYPLISMDIHAWAYYGFSIQGSGVGARHPFCWIEGSWADALYFVFLSALSAPPRGLSAYMALINSVLQLLFYANLCKSFQVCSNIIPFY